MALKNRIAVMAGATNCSQLPAGVGGATVAATGLLRDIGATDALLMFFAMVEVLPM